MKFFKILLCVILIGISTQQAQASALRPRVRIGLYATEKPVVVTADHDVSITVNKKNIQTILAHQPITLNYDLTANTYHANTASWEYASASAIHITPIIKPTILTITNYTNSPAWNTTLNDNSFLGSLAIHYSVPSHQVWVVNTLGIENYIKGVAEAGNDNPPAYLQTLYTAARSYAYFNYIYPTKHAGEPYLLDTTANDQVYRGYNFTQRAPNIVAAVNATRGMIIEYNNEPVVTPYFSSSDGRTRAWSEVWSGDRPYLQSVSDPGCIGLALTGHGVGLSALGARYFANQGWDATKILQYYYTGVTLEKMW